MNFFSFAMCLDCLGLYARRRTDLVNCATSFVVNFPQLPPWVPAMLVTSPKVSQVRFGPFTADLRSGEVRRNGRKIRIQEQPFRLLAILLERPGEVVLRGEIGLKIWGPPTFVDLDHSLGTAVAKLRAALGDSAERPKYVETLPKRGFRFIGTIVTDVPTSPPRHELQDSVFAAKAEPLRAQDLHASPHLTLSRFYTRFSAIGILVLSCLGLALIATRSAPSQAASGAPIRSLAVLPLESLSANPDEVFLADGMTDELITSLAKIGSLRVISRTSVMPYRGTHKTVPEIARELGVDGVVEGAILRSGGRVRINAQLIQVLYRPSPVG
jgi:TolB-like protein/DNA-binding winged helix-turn-helix (wHTH) protein